MRRFLHVLAILGLLAAAGLTVLAILLSPPVSPPDQLFFAFPQFLLVMAALVGVPSAILFLLTRSRPPRAG